MQQLPQSLKNIKKRISKLINNIGEAICYICGIAAILAIMIPAGYLASLIPAIPMISIIIIGCATPLFFGSYAEIFEVGYNSPQKMYDFLTTPLVNLKNSFKRDVLGITLEAESTNPFSNNNNQNHNMGFMAYAKSWCPAFLCYRNNNNIARKDSNYTNDLEEEKDPNYSPRLTKGGYRA